MFGDQFHLPAELDYVAVVAWALSGALVGLRKQTRLHLGRQRRRRHVEAQMRRGGHLVHVLPSGALEGDSRDQVIAAYQEIMRMPI